MTNNEKLQQVEIKSIFEPFYNGKVVKFGMYELEIAAVKIIEMCQKSGDIYLTFCADDFVGSTYLTGFYLLKRYGWLDNMGNEAYCANELFWGRIFHEGEDKK